MNAPKMIYQGLVFPEGPRWHDNKLWLSDMHAHSVMTVDAAGKVETVAKFDDRPSGLGFLPDGTPLAVLMRSRRVVKFGAGGISVHGDFTRIPGTHLGEMVVDGQGRAYVGNREHSAQASDKRSPETIELVMPDGSIQTAADDLWGPNGSAITADGRTIVVAESRANRITAFAIQPDGMLTDRRIFAELGLVPDGVCVDAEGAAWVSAVHKGEYWRVREGGEIVDRVKLSEGKWAVACVLGGPDRRTLYMATAFETLEHFFSLVDFQADLKSTARGFLETVQVDVPGAGWP